MINNNFDSLKGGGGDKYNINLIINGISIKNSDNIITKKLFIQNVKYCHYLVILELEKKNKIIIF